MGFRRLAQHGMLLLGLLCVVLYAHGSTACAQEAIDRAAALEEQVETLRRDGEYEAALESARELLALLQQDEEAKPHEVVDAEWLVKTLERVVGFSEEQKREYAKAKSMDEICAICWSERRFADALVGYPSILRNRCDSLTGWMDFISTSGSRQIYGRKKRRLYPRRRVGWCGYDPRDFQISTTFVCQLCNRFFDSLNAGHDSR